MRDLTSSPPEEPRAAAAAADLPLRDYLSAERTELANETTLLAYLRTALAFAITGGTLLRLLTGPLWTAGGIFFLLAGLATVVIGAWRYRRMHMHLAALRAPREEAP